MKKLNVNKQAIIHSSVWILLGLFPFMFFGGNIHFNPNFLISYYIRIGAIFIMFYMNFFYLIDAFLLSKKLISYILINLSLFFVLYVLIYYFDKEYILPILNSRMKTKEYKPPHINVRIIREFLTFIFVLGFSISMKIIRKWFEDERKLKELQNQKSEAELQQLKSQLNPHFLFNTLNNIYALVSIDQEKAQHAIHRLSNMLRYALYEDNQVMVPLTKELEFIKNYIELMKLRLSGNVDLKVDIESGNGDEQIAPLLFISLIENAFKHGTSPVSPSYIHVQISVQSGEKIICKVENSTYETSMNDKPFTKGNEDKSCEHHMTTKNKLSTYETSMNDKPFTKGNEDKSCEHHMTTKNKLSTYETSMNDKPFAKGNEDESCEHHMTTKNKLSTYETSMNDKPFTKGNEDESCEEHMTTKNKLSTYETSMNDKPFTKGNEDESCEEHMTTEIKLSTYECQQEDRSGSGIGLKNCKRRLELLYPQKHVFIAEKIDEHHFLALVEIDLH